MYYVFLKKKNGTTWHNITDYVLVPITINDLSDGGYDECSFTARFTESFTFFDARENLPPKTEIKISEALDESEQNETNTYWFLSDDSHQTRIRKANELDNMAFEHQIKGVERLKLLEDTFMPNYTITQPKTQYFDAYGISSNARFNINQKISAQNHPYDLTLNQGSLEILNQMNNGDSTITFGYENNKHFVRLNKVDETSFNLNFGLSFSKTARTFYRKSVWWWTEKINIMASEFRNGEWWGDYAYSEFKVITTKEYYNDLDELIKTENKTVDVLYSGGEVKVVDNKITTLPTATKQEITVNVETNSNASYAKVYFRIPYIRVEHNWDGNRALITNINGFDNDSFVKTLIESLQINVVSGNVLDEVVENKQTLLDFLEKALFDYNLNRRDKVSLSNELKTLLSVEAKESEWSGYNFKELVERVLKYRGAIPYLTHDNVLKYIVPINQSRFVDLDETQDTQKTIIDADFYDRVVGNSKNLVSEVDYTTERILIGSTETEFSQFTESNAGFLTSQNIYFIKQGIIYAPNISFTFQRSDGGANIVINSNMGKPYYWDITSRLLERDIYNALPDARFDQRKTATQPSPRATRQLGQGNTIPFTSGSNIVFNLCHRAPTIPTFNATGGVMNGNIAEYAIIETIICLAYEALPVPATQIIDIKPDLEFDSIKNIELELVYCPIFKELTTKYVSNQSERNGLNWEKKLNVSERVISYQDNQEILMREMERKGNSNILITEYHESMSTSIPSASIINDYYYVSSKTMTLNRNVISVDYTLQKNFILQNDDIRLSVEYERYTVPYEYVQREIMVDNHLIFSKGRLTKYDNDIKGCDSDFFATTLFNVPTHAKGNLNGNIYAQLRIKYTENDNQVINYTLMRIAKLESRFSMVLTGKFLDNYSAGNQRLLGTMNTNQYEFTQPYKYTDYAGKIESIDNVIVGFTPQQYDTTFDNTTRLAIYVEAEPESYLINYPIKMFPSARPDNQEVVIITRLFDTSVGENILTSKDAREAVALTHTTYLETEDEYNIKWYSFKPVNLIANLVDYDYKPFGDDLSLDDLDMRILEDASFTISANKLSDTQYEVIVRLFNKTKNNFNKGIVFLNKEGNRYTLCGILRSPDWQYDNETTFNIATTRYGKI